MRWSHLPLLLLVLLSPPARAEEGFWPFDRFPLQHVKARFGVDLDPAMLERASRASVEVFGEGGGALVSPNGLVAVKHGTVKHCLHALRDARKHEGRFSRLCQDQAVRRAIPLFDRLYCRPHDRAAEYDFLERGHLARTAEEELRCPDFWINRLEEVTDVTARFSRVLGPAPAAANSLEAEARLRKQIEGECQTTAQSRCRVISLHGGARYQLLRSRRYHDVRLVFAPERRVADFGDLQDHMTFPDHDFKAAFVRLYEDGKPAATPDFLRFSTRRVQPGELTLMVNYTGSAGRFALSSLLERQRDHLSMALAMEVELRGIFSQIAARRPALAPSFDFDNRNFTMVGLTGRLRGLSDELIARRAAEEQQLLAELERRGDPGLPALRQALAAANSAHQSFSQIKHRATAMAALDWSNLFRLAESAVQVGRSSEERFRRELLRVRVLDEEVETAVLEVVLRKLQETFPPDDPFLRKALGDQSVRERARTLVRGSRLLDRDFRRQLTLPGGAALATNDPFVQFLRLLHQDARPAIQRWRNADTLGHRCSELMAAARYRLHGDALFPDGTGTVRISVGALEGYEDAGRQIHPVTTLGDLFELSRGEGPYQLPSSWRAVRATLDLSTPLNLATSNDGGPAGALVDSRGELVGIGFMGNRYSNSVAGYDARSRLVSVSGAAVAELLAHVYGATRLLAELGLAPKAAPRR